MSSSSKALPPELQSFMLKPESIAPPPGIRTGLAVFDNYVLWKGLPKGELSVLEGLQGTGATSFWLEAVKSVQGEKKWAAFVSDQTVLMPQHLKHRGLNLSKLLIVKKPQDKDNFFWILQEMITSSLFETIGCQLTEMQLAQHQLLKLKKLCRTYKVALVFLTQKSMNYGQHLLALCLQFKDNFITIKKAAHRLTPFTFDSGALYANNLPQLLQKYR